MLFSNHCTGTGSDIGSSNSSDQFVKPFFRFLGVAIFIFIFTACSIESHKSRTPPQGDTNDFAASQGTMFRVDSIIVNGASTAEIGQFGLPLAKTFNFLACLKDFGGNALPLGLQFRITDSDATELIRVTDANSCLSWSETIRYKQLDAETYFRIERKIESLDSYKGLVKVQVALDPWSSTLPLIDVRTQSLPGGRSISELQLLSKNGNHGTESPEVHSVDGQSQISMPHDETQNQIATDGKKPTAQLPEIHFESLGHDPSSFEMTPLLGLRIAHRYRITMQPLFLRKTLDRGLIAEPLRSGPFKVYIAIMKENWNRTSPTKQVLSQAVFEGNLSDSHGNGLTSIVTMMFDNVSELLSRSTVLITLLPQGELAQMGELNFTGVNQPGYLKPIPVVPTLSSARTIIEQHRKEMSTQRVWSALELFAAKSKMKEMDLKATSVPTGNLFFNRYEDISDVRERLESFLGTEPKADETDTVPNGSVASLACEKTFGKHGISTSSTVDVCARHPERFLQFGRRQLITKILSPPQRVLTLPPESILSSVYFELSRTTALGWKTAIGAGLSGSIGPSVDIGLGSVSIGSLSLRLSGSAEGTYFVEQRVVDTARVSSSRDTTISVDGAIYSFQAENIRCLIAQLKKPNQSENDASGIYYCSEKKLIRQQKETYFLLNSNPGVLDSPFTDANSTEEARWRSFVRGQGTMAMLRQFLQKSPLGDFRMLIGKIPDQDSLFQDIKEFATTQEFPGLLPDLPSGKGN